MHPAQVGTIPGGLDLGLMYVTRGTRQNRAHRNGSTDLEDRRLPNRLHPPLAGGELYAQSPVPLGNGTFSPDGRLVVSHHPMCETPVRVSVFTGQPTLAPFPDEAWNTSREGSDDWLDAVPGQRTDARGHV